MRFDSSRPTPPWLGHVACTGPRLIRRGYRACVDLWPPLISGGGRGEAGEVGQTNQVETAAKGREEAGYGNPAYGEG